MLKGADAHLRFVFLTGVSKFSKVSLFSGLNNLLDLTLDTQFSALCGYTDADIDSVFAPELPGLDREDRDAALALLAERTASTMVTRIGHVAVLYKPNPQVPRIVLPG